MSRPKVTLKIIQAREVLGVQEDASEVQIKKAYHKLAIKNHPDKFQCEDEKKAAQERFIKIKEAYEYIINGEEENPLPEVVEVEVYGRVVRAKSRTSETFTVMTEDGDKVTCLYTGFMPMRQGDAILGLAQHRGNNRIFMNAPFMAPGHDSDTLLDTIYLALKGPKFYRKKAEDIVNLLIKRAGDSEGACIMMDRLSTFFNYSQETDLTDLNIGDNDPYVAFSLIIDNNQFSKLLYYWYKQRVLRKLYLLGLNNSEIKGSRSNPLGLYDKILTNPYLIASVKLDKCEDILKRCGRRVSGDFKECGKIVRKLAEMMDKGGWTGVPSSTAQRLFPKIKEHLPLLRKEFGVVTELRTVYLDYAQEAEVGVAEWTKELINSEPVYLSNEPIFTRSDLSVGQKEAVVAALQNNLSIVTGPGGSGKTHVIKEICHNLERQGVGYKLASFTGKAVTRIREVTESKEASTLHLMITMQSKQTKPTWRHLIIDEASMVTTELLYQFRRKFTHDYKITLVGDINQLQPIGWGSYFSSLITTNLISTVRLKQIFRTVENGKNGILINSQRIINHAEPDYKSSQGDDHDQDLGLNYNGPEFSFEITPNFKILIGDVTMVQKLVQLLSNNGIPSSETVIVSPYNKDLSLFNRCCSELYNGVNRATTDNRGQIWRIGDRVMHTQNNYQYNLMNGHEGIVVDVSAQWVTVKYVENHYKYLTGKVPEDETTTELYVEHLVHSYACSVHRLQGSEANYVIGYIPETSSSNNFLNRNLLYTLITRAKKSIWLVGDPESMERAATTSPSWRN